MGRRRWTGRRITRALPAAVAALALPAAALAAAAADHWQVHLNATGQAAARAVVLKSSDLPSGGWTGGAQKADVSDQPPCAGFNPKQSDLVLVGAAHTLWTRTGVRIDSNSDVLLTAKMVRLDWQRTVLAPEVLPCLRRGLTKAVAPASVVSFGPVAFPTIGSYSRAFRAVVEAKNGTQTARVILDFVAFGRGRTEGMLNVAAPAAVASALRPLELELARLLAARARG